MARPSSCQTADNHIAVPVVVVTSTVAELLSGCMHDSSGPPSWSINKAQLLLGKNVMS